MSTDPELIPDLTEARYGRPTYPWSEWLDGQARRLVRGTHFRCNASSLRQMAYDEAKARGVRVKTVIRDGGAMLDMQAVRP